MQVSVSQLKLPSGEVGFIGFLTCALLSPFFNCYLCSEIVQGSKEPHDEHG